MSGAVILANFSHPFSQQQQQQQDYSEMHYNCSGKPTYKSPNNQSSPTTTAASKATQPSDEIVFEDEDDKTCNFEDCDTFDGDYTVNQDDDDIIFEDEEEQAGYKALRYTSDCVEDGYGSLDHDDDGGLEESFDEDSFESVVPEWFSHEDKDQIKIIFEAYAYKLQLAEEHKRCIREPPKFVGRIKRNKVFSDDDEFQTLDEVEIYRRAILPPGSLMPHSKTVYILTTWSTLDGLPIDFSVLSNGKKRQIWRDRVDGEHPASYLLCEPVFSTDSKSSEYDYFVVDYPQEVRHSPSSYSYHSYEEHIPSVATIKRTVSKEQFKLSGSPIGNSCFEEREL